MSSTYSSVPWTAEEMTGFEAFNPPCFSIVPVHLFWKHSVNRPHEFVDEKYYQLEWLPPCPISIRLYSTMDSRGVETFRGVEPILLERHFLPPFPRAFSQSTSRICWWKIFPTRMAAVISNTQSGVLYHGQQRKWHASRHWTHLAWALFLSTSSQTVPEVRYAIHGQLASKYPIMLWGLQQQHIVIVSYFTDHGCRKLSLLPMRALLLHSSLSRS